MIFTYTILEVWHILSKTLRSPLIAWGEQDTTPSRMKRSRTTWKGPEETISFSDLFLKGRRSYPIFTSGLNSSWQEAWNVVLLAWSKLQWARLPLPQQDGVADHWAVEPGRAHCEPGSSMYWLCAFGKVLNLTIPVYKVRLFMRPNFLDFTESKWGSPRAVLSQRMGEWSWTVGIVYVVSRITV